MEKFDTTLVKGIAALLFIGNLFCMVTGVIPSNEYTLALGVVLFTAVVIY